MDYKEYRPPTDIADLIECYWTNTLHPEDFNQAYDYIIPDGSTEAIFMLKGHYLRDDEHQNDRHLVKACSLVPAFHKAVKVYQKPHTTCLGVRFKPGAITRLTGVSLAELDKPTYTLQQLMPEMAEQTMDKVLGNRPVPELIESVNRWVSSRKKEANTNHMLAGFINDTIKQKGCIQISRFCEKFGMHKSTLEKNFKHETGLTPKQYANLIRFNYLLHHLFFNNKNLTESGHELGYFDQSHMIKDFQKVIGIAPREFLRKNFSVPKLAAMAISNKPAHFTH